MIIVLTTYVTEQKLMQATMLGVVWIDGITNPDSRTWPQEDWRVRTGGRCVAPREVSAIGSSRGGSGRNGHESTRWNG